MISLLKYLDGDWAKVRGYLREDLDHIESALNQRWSRVFTDGNVLSAGAIAGDSTIASRSVTNTGTGNTPTWAQVNLTNGVTGDLPLANIVPGSALSVLGVTGNATADYAPILAANDHQVLRRSGTAVAFGAINLASTAAVTGDLPFANMVQIANMRILGRSTAGTGDIQSLNTLPDDIQQAITQLGAITIGQWKGTPVGGQYGGTGLSSYVVGDLLIADGVTSLNRLADVAVGSVLISSGVGVTPAYSQTPVLGNSTNGYLALDRDGDSGITSATAGWTATPQARFRLTRAIPDSVGAEHFLITPYAFGMAFEYPGTVEWWVGEFSVHKDPTIAAGARFWVGDETDSGGLYVTASDSQNWVEVASQKFSLASHGDLFFRVVSATDDFKWNVGAAASFAPVATLSGTGVLSLTSVNPTNPAAAQATFTGWEEIIGVNAASGQILLGNASSAQGRLHYHAGTGTLYLDNSFNASIALRVDTSGTPVTALALTGVAATFSGSIIGALGTASQAVFAGWEEIIGTNSASGQIMVGNVAASQGRLHYHAGTGTLYLDNSYDVAAAAIKFRTRTSNTAVDALVLSSQAAVFVAPVSTPGVLVPVTGSVPTMASNTAGFYANDVGGVTNMFGIAEDGTVTRVTWGAPQTYTESNVTTDRAFNANATSVDELADVLGTLIVDLRARGVVA